MLADVSIPLTVLPQPPVAHKLGGARPTLSVLRRLVHPRVATGAEDVWLSCYLAHEMEFGCRSNNAEAGRGGWARMLAVAFSATNSVALAFSGLDSLMKSNPSKDPQNSILTTAVTGRKILYFNPV